MLLTASTRTQSKSSRSPNSDPHLRDVPHVVDTNLGRSRGRASNQPRAIGAPGSMMIMSDWDLGPHTLNRHTHTLTHTA